MTNVGTNFSEETLSEYQNGKSGFRLSALATPVGNFAEAFCVGSMEQPNEVADVFEFVDIGPDFRLPAMVVNGGHPAGCTAGMPQRCLRHGKQVGLAL